MFNFLVTSSAEAWNLRGNVYDRGRFLEYTSDEIAARFHEIKDPQIQTLTELPRLFAFEGTDEPMRVARLKRVKSRQGGRLLSIEPQLTEVV